MLLLQLLYSYPGRRAKLPPKGINELLQQPQQKKEKKKKKRGGGGGGGDGWVMGGGDVKMNLILELHLLIARQSLTLSLPRDISFLQICPQDAPVQQLFLNCLFLQPCLFPPSYAPALCVRWAL